MNSPPIPSCSNENFCFHVGDYSFGFQSQEKDDAIKGPGNCVNYAYRIQDARLGRFFSIDPLTHEYPHYTPYSFSGNKLISHREREGLEEELVAACSGPVGWGYIIVKWTIITVTTYYAVEATAHYLQQAPSIPGIKASTEGQPEPANSPKEDTKGKPLPSPSPNPVLPSVDTSIEEKKKEDPKYIYRSGANTDITYTPSEKDLNSGGNELPGLSAFTTPEAAAQGRSGEKVQKLSVDVLRKEGMTVIFDKGNHVTITTRNRNNLLAWVQSKNFLEKGKLGQLKSHYLTRKVASSRVEEVRSK